MNAPSNDSFNALSKEGHKYFQFFASSDSNKFETGGQSTIENFIQLMRSHRTYNFVPRSRPARLVVEDLRRS